MLNSLFVKKCDKVIFSVTNKIYNVVTITVTKKKKKIITLTRTALRVTRCFPALGISNNKLVVPVMYTLSRGSVISMVQKFILVSRAVSENMLKYINGNEASYGLPLTVGARQQSWKLSQAPSALTL